MFRAFESKFFHGDHVTADHLQNGARMNGERGQWGCPSIIRCFLREKGNVLVNQRGFRLYLYVLLLKVFNPSTHSQL
jgi:hypothetical protein